MIEHCISSLSLKLMIKYEPLFYHLSYRKRHYLFHTPKLTIKPLCQFQIYYFLLFALLYIFRNYFIILTNLGQYNHIFNIIHVFFIMDLIIIKCYYWIWVLLFIKKFLHLTKLNYTNILIKNFIVIYCSTSNLIVFKFSSAYQLIIKKICIQSQ